MRIFTSLQSIIKRKIKQQVPGSVKKFKPAKMVNWYRPGMLFDTALKASISATFGNYADRREMQAALVKDDDEEWKNIMLRYRGDKKDLWFDFISDTGDGFDSTFSVAKLAAEDKLLVKDEGQSVELPRASVLILGGDLVYPTPTAELYEQKFSIPYACALPKWKFTKSPRPHLYAIPGNHDWYDGLGNFIKLICQNRNVGGWSTQQKRSYFAIPLPHNYWIWATDVQLNADIDEPQQCYFRDVAKRMDAGDKVILITAEPSWIYREMYSDDKSNARLVYFIEHFIKGAGDSDHDKYLESKKLTLSVILTGDLHHYSRYEGVGQAALCRHYIGAGGGGAFLHLTHSLPEKLHEPAVNSSQMKNTLPTYAKLVKVFPDAKTSRRLDLGNLLFPLINRSFGAAMGMIYLLVFWSLQSRLTTSGHFYNLVDQWSVKKNCLLLGECLLQSPFLLISLVFFAVAICRFADTRSGRFFTKIIGSVHALVQFVLIFAVILLTVMITKKYLCHLTLSTQLVVVASGIFLAGWLFSGSVFGVYLYLSHNKWLRMHVNEASSSLTCEHYKNFLRIHISEEGIRIFPIKIPKVTKKWKRTGEGPNMRITGEIPGYELIERSILIQ